MRSVKQKNTRPEIAVRKLVHALGYRFRLHCERLPGRPDLVLPRRCLAVFVHGCYWHRHEHCQKSSTPSSNVEFWSKKFEANLARDARKHQELEDLGWRVLVVWECETRDLKSLKRRLATELAMRP